MSTTPSFPLATVAAQVTAAGISAPSYADILSSFQASVQAIFGSDVVIDPDSKDGQLLAILAQAQYDSNQCAIAAYNSYNPQTAIGAALDSAIKVNGLRRLVPSYSTAPLYLVGQAGVQIYSGIVQDSLNNLWDLPISLTFPPSGVIETVGVCETPGAVAAATGTINTPFTQVVGWQSVTNTAAATPGAPVETDGQLRERQAISTSLLAETTADSLLARVLAVPGVKRAAIYVNDTAATDPATGIPSHSFTMVVDETGVDLEVAQAIEAAKDIGAGTYGNTTVNVSDPDGQPIDIHFDVLGPTLGYVPIKVAVEIKTLPGFIGTTVSQLSAALAAFVNGLDIGQDVYLSWMQSVATLNSNPTYVVVSLTQAKVTATLAAADIVIAYNQAPTLDPANITITGAP